MPSYFVNVAFKTKLIEGQRHIYDRLRKRYVALTPEEWVRQQLISYFADIKKYPLPLMAVERGIRVNKVSKRFDLLVYHREKPWMLVECKSPDCKLNDHTLSQVLAYNSILKVAYVCVCNGPELWTYNVEEAEWMEGAPDYPLRNL